MAGEAGSRTHHVIARERPDGLGHGALVAA
jgi:hypothetical protein